MNCYRKRMLEIDRTIAKMSHNDRRIKYITCPCGKKMLASSFDCHNSTKKCIRIIEYLIRLKLNN